MRNIKVLSKRSIVSATIVAILFVPLVSLIIQNVQAGTATSASLTLSDSRAAGTAVTYAFAFTTTVTTSIKQVDITFCGTSITTCAAPSGMSMGTPTLGSDNLAGTGRTTTAPTTTSLRVVVTTPASQATQAVTMSFTGLTNPSTINSTYWAKVRTYSDTGSTLIDQVDVAFAVLDTTSLAVTATVDPSLSFSLTGVASGVAINGTNTSATTVGSLNAIPFGTLTSGGTNLLAHQVDVTTNATNGYQVTVRGLLSPVLNDGVKNIDDWTGTNAVPTTWSAPAGTSPSVNTGYLGYTTTDSSLDVAQGATRFTSAVNKYAGFTTTATNNIVAYSSTGLSTSEAVKVGWRTEINALQPSGNYAGTVILVATPTY